jgi:hypothetical protein
MYLAFSPEHAPSLLLGGRAGGGPYAGGSWGSGPKSSAGGVLEGGGNGVSFPGSRPGSGAVATAMTEDDDLGKDVAL